MVVTYILNPQFRILTFCLTFYLIFRLNEPEIRNQRDPEIAQIWKNFIEK